MSLTGNGGNGGGTFENITKSVPQNLQMQSIHQPLNHQLPPPPLMPWPNHLMGAPPYLHTAAQHQQHMYNIHTQPVAPTASAAPSGQQESYSMLRMGNGNFLKIYHCAENALGAMPVEAPFTLNQMYNQQSPQTHLQTAYHHVPQRNVSSSQQYPQTSQIQQTAAAAAAGVSQMFNSYELFSSNTFAQLRTPDIAPLLLVGQRENATNDNDRGKTNHSAQNEINADHGATGEEGNANAANMIINNLVNNWSHNLTGGIYTQFGTQANSLQEEEDITSSSLINQTHGTQLHLLNDVPPMSVNQVQTDMISVPSQLHMDAHNIAADQVPHGSVEVSPEDFLQVDYKNNATDEVKLLAPISSSANSRLKQDIPRNQEAPKKRIVAEVKPMRMTYSDVLSKFNDTPEEQQQRQQHPVTNATQHPNNATANNKTNLKSNKIDSIGCNSSASNNRRNADESTGAVRVIPKKSPIHENKENVLNSVTQQVAHGKATSGSFTKRSTVMFSSSCSNNAATNASTSQKATQSQKKVTSAANNADASMKRRNTNSKKSSEKDIEHGEGGKGHISKSNASATVGSSNTSSYIGNACGRKTTRETNHSINNNNSCSNGTPSQQQQQQQTHRLRYQGNSNISYSYSSTKRSRNNNSINNNNSNNNNNANYNYNQCNANNTHNNNNTAYVLAGGGGGNKHTPNYDLAKRFLMVWYACSMKLLTWLFYLIYDIIVLGCSILYDHLRHSCEAGCVYACHLYRDLKKNSNKPGIWLRNRWRYFDAYFTKNSKWAFWRRFYKKRPPEQINESNKNGRLPQTGEEAMYSLLNCKGKDAYSILGVPSNSSPEQIRKHYKKIAVLVHPDKNKQPGAEEAFKVLQRAFELIGEPENRLAYDHSLAEALHAEKAWTELHDLLSQLQTKITEAANTIRCSTCGLRHPRKLSDRPHYAARECASCKIRHSAREGDIWAETSMMGLRWKYLALMEGKVYDITAWANCQKGALAHLEPNSHMVQYRIVRGAQQQQRQQQKQQTNHPHKHSRSGHQNYGTGGGSRSATGAGGKFKCDNIPPSEASLHEFLDNLYSGQHPHNQQNTTTGHATSSRRRNRRN